MAAEEEGEEPEQVKHKGGHEPRLWPDGADRSTTYWTDDVLAKDRLQRGEPGGSGRPSDVAMVEAADFAERKDPAEFLLLNWPAVGCILVERQVSAGPVIVRKIASQGTAQVRSPRTTT